MPNRSTISSTARIVIRLNQKGQNQGGNLPSMSSPIQVKAMLLIGLAIPALGVAACGSDSTGTAETAASVPTTTADESVTSVPATPEPAGPFDAATKSLEKQGFKVEAGDETGYYTPPAAANIDVNRGDAHYWAALFTTEAEAKAAASKFNLDRFGPSAALVVKGPVLYGGAIEQPATLPDFDLFMSLAVPEQP